MLAVKQAIGMTKIWLGTMGIFYYWHVLCWDRNIIMNEDLTSSLHREDIAVQNGALQFRFHGLVQGHCIRRHFSEIFTLSYCVWLYLMYCMLPTRFMNISHLEKRSLQEKKIKFSKHSFPSQVLCSFKWKNTCQLLRKILKSV